MPKIIKDIEEIIFQTALNMFTEYGYKSVDMKGIAKNAGIAVGTLYNYYPNKQQLFLDVFKKSWEDTFSRLDGHAKFHGVSDFIEILYDEIDKRKGLGKQLTDLGKQREELKEQFYFIKEGLRKRFIDILNSEDNKGQQLIEMGMDERLLEMVINATVGMLIKYSNEREKNIEFLNRIINGFFG